MLSTELEETLRRALAAAAELNHEFCTLEHLLLALISDPDAQKVMRACDVDIEELTEAVETFLRNELDDLVREDGVDPRPTMSFQRAFERAILLVQGSGRGQATGANVVTDGGALLHEAAAGCWRESMRSEATTEQPLLAADVHSQREFRGVDCHRPM